VGYKDVAKIYVCSFLRGHSDCCSSLQHAPFRQVASHNFCSSRGSFLLVHIFVFAAHLSLLRTVRSYLGTCSSDLFLPFFAFDRSTPAEGVVTFDIGQKIVVGKVQPFSANKESEASNFL